MFTETLGSRKMADTLADDLGPARRSPSTRSRASTDGSTDDYLSIMRTNLANLKEANGC